MISKYFAASERLRIGIAQRPAMPPSLARRRLHPAKGVHGAYRSLLSIRLSQAAHQSIYVDRAAGIREGKLLSHDGLYGTFPAARSRSYFAFRSALCQIATRADIRMACCRFG
jgi:hypothetical protein